MHAVPDIESLQSQYRERGLCTVRSLIPAAVTEAAVRGAEDVVAGRYRTGRAPLHRQCEVGDTSGRLLKVTQPHYASAEIAALIRHPAIGRLAAELTGAALVQVWAVDLLVKPPRSARTAGVGWHRDCRYMQYWSGEVFTAWIALADVPEDGGPVTYRPGSHRWTGAADGDFFDTDDLPEPATPGGGVHGTWAAVVPRGTVIIHHPRILHASGVNRSVQPRPAVALRLRTDRAGPVPGASHPLLARLDDEDAAPVIHRS
jgi:ectoine hydroxylase-related dioxygenase (phytanoyl-CoA dioxygenase family)